MVRVKRGGRFVSVSPGQDVSRVGGGSSSNDRRRAQQQQIDKILADMRAGRISRGDAAAGVKTIQRGGGTGAAADPAKFQKAQEALKKFEAQKLERKRLQEKLAVDKAAAAKLDTARKTEFKKILDKRARIIARRGRERTQISRDVRTGNQLRITTWTQGSNRVRRVEDAKTGAVKYTSFGVGKAGGGVRMTGGVIVGAPAKVKDVPGIVDIPGDPTKKRVILRSGKQFNISATGRVVVGAQFAGQRLEFFNGKLVTDIDKVPAREGFTLTSTEETEINKLLPNNIELVKDKTGLIIGTINKNTGKRESIAAIDKYIEQKAEADLKAQGKIVESFTNLTRKWTKDIGENKRILTDANKRGDLDKLIELQKLGNKATTAQKAERERLEKQTAKNYKLGGELVGKIIGTTLINMGLGSRELLKNLKKDPIATLIALPPAVYEGVKEDFNRVMAGDPLEIGQVGLEYYTLGKVFGVLGKAAKPVFKTSVSIGRTLSPKYFSGMGRKLLIPPSTLRGVLGKTAIGIRTRAIIKTTLKRTGVTRRVNSFVRNVKRQRIKALKPVRRIKKIRKVGKALKEVEIKKFRSAVELRNQLKRARRARRLARNKGKTINIGNRDFIEAVAFIEEVADNLAKVEAKQFIKSWKKKGGKLGLGQEEQFVRAVQRYVSRKLNEAPRFNRLKNYSKLTEPFQIKLLKVGKISSATKLARNLKAQIGKFPIVKQMGSIIKKVTRKVRRIKRKVSPKRIKTKIRKVKVRRAKVREFRKTNRYRMEKARVNRKVTLEQLNRARTISETRKFVDKFFDEVGRRNKVDVSSLQYRQFKNVIKRRLDKAIKTGNKAELRKFAEAVKKIVDDMNKKSNQPKIKVFEKGVKPRRIRTIKDFKPETPKGKYIEVSKGQQVLVQEIKQIQKAKVTQRILQKPRVFVIEAVQKQKISLKPLLRYGVVSLSALAIKNIQKSKQVFATTPTTAQLSGVLQDSAQDLRSLQAVAQAFGVNVAQAVAQAVKQKRKPVLKTKLTTKQKLKQKRLRLKRKPQRTRTLSKKVMTYGFVVRKAGKQVKLKIPPLTLLDAWNVGAYRLDNALQRTGKLIPLGKTNKVAVIPKVARGYYGKHKKKFRRFRQKKGKRFTLERVIIERKKYIGDRPSEIKQLQAARRKKAAKTSRRKPPVKRKVVKRKVPPAREKSKRFIKKKNVIKQSQKKNKPKKVVKKRLKRKPVKKKPLKRKGSQKSSKKSSQKKRKTKRKKK